MSLEIDISMITLDLNTLSSDALDSVKTVLEALSENEDLAVTQGSQLLYTLRKTQESEPSEIIVRGTYQAGDKPSDTFRDLKKADALEDISAEELRQQAWAGRGV